MFERPTKDDIDRALSRLAADARQRLTARRNDLTAMAIGAGGIQNSRMIIVVAEAADAVHSETMQHAESILTEFVKRMDISPSQVEEWAKPQLEELGDALLKEIPSRNFPEEHQRIAKQYRAQFEQRLSDTFLNLRIGFSKENGFSGAVEKNTWVGAAESVTMLKPILTERAAQLRICERASAGLIRARADQFHRGEKILRNCRLPQEFWWARGQAALTQNWPTGDFSTWINGSTELKAFGVQFEKTDIQKILPQLKEVGATVRAHTEEDEQIISKLESLVPSAALSYKQALHDLKDSGRVSFRGSALELREALREILDHLAPDNEVTAAPGYAQDNGRNGPTMKQKVRFIMKKKAMRSSSDAPESAASAFEQTIAELTRSVYELSSKATHVSREREKVEQLRRYVVVIFHDILGT